MCCAADNHNYTWMCHTCVKEFFDSNLNLAIIDKISHFHEIAQIPHIHINRNFSSIFATF